MNQQIYVINLWGLGDLIPTLRYLSNHEGVNVKLLTLQKRKAVTDIVKLLNRDNSFQVLYLGKFLTAIYLSFLSLRGNRLIFSAPLSGKARLFAEILNKLSTNIYLAEEDGNIYSINYKLFKERLD
jgi:hypothetical protein